MRAILRNIRQYALQSDKKVFALCTLVMAISIFINYRLGLNRSVIIQSNGRQILSWYFIFLFLFGTGYFFAWLLTRSIQTRDRTFWVLLLSAPAIFAWKMAADVSLPLHMGEELNAYWNQVAYWPIKLVVVSSLLAVAWKLFSPRQPFYGASEKNFHWRPYLLMLVMMVPLVAAASTQADFLATYPKLKNISFLHGTGTGWYQFLFELSYGSDFITIELFFRGFLVLAFTRFAGEKAILPMAMFYCSIHFGKPLGECISSYFGGLLLGIVIYHSRSIYGGLVVHLGIAWLMELGGWLGGGF